MAEADDTQIRILNESRQRLEDIVGETGDALELLTLLSSAASAVGEALPRAPYLAGSIVVLLSEFAERLRCTMPVDRKVAEACCNEILDMKYNNAKERRESL